MAQFISDSLRIMRLAIGRRNANDPDSSDNTLLQYISDFMTLTMTDDLKLFEQFGTLEFTIDETVTDGVYTFNDVGATNTFSNISMEGFITLTNPPAGSVSWNRLAVYMDPGVFYDIWGVNNTDILIAGYPTEMLYYGTEMVFRTIPDTSYDVILYGYKVLASFNADDGEPANAELPQDSWMRYIAYGAAKNYASDYRYGADQIQLIDKGFSRERKLLLTRTHNQRKVGRCQPQF